MSVKLLTYNGRVKVKDENDPDTLILNTSDLIDRFNRDIWGIKLDRKDLEEIIAQIITAMLNDTSGNAMYHLVKLPDYGRLRFSKGDPPYANIDTLSSAVQTLARKIYERVKQLGAYKGTDFPYFFSKFIGNDLILARLIY